MLIESLVHLELYTASKWALLAFLAIFTVGWTLTYIFEKNPMCIGTGLIGSVLILASFSPSETAKYLNQELEFEYLLLIKKQENHQLEIKYLEDKGYKVEMASSKKLDEMVHELKTKITINELKEAGFIVTSNTREGV